MKKIIGAICVPTIFTVLLNLLMLGNVYCNYQKYYNDLYLIGLMFLILFAAGVLYFGLQKYSVDFVYQISVIVTQIIMVFVAELILDNVVRAHTWDWLGYGGVILFLLCAVSSVAVIDMIRLGIEYLIRRRKAKKAALKRIEE